MPPIVQVGTAMGSKIPRKAEFVSGILSNNERSGETSIEDFDRINGVNYRGLWLTSRAELKQMVKQDPLPT